LKTLLPNLSIKKKDKIHAKLLNLGHLLVELRRKKRLRLLVACDAPTYQIGGKEQFANLVLSCSLAGARGQGLSPIKSGLHPCYSFLPRACQIMIPVSSLLLLFSFLFERNPFCLIDPSNVQFPKNCMHMDGSSSTIP
jgi:hypothetical protein